MARRILRRRRSSPNQKTILRLLPGEALTLDSRMVGKPYLGITSDRRDSWNLGQHVAKILKNGQTKTQISRPSRVQSPVPFVWGFEAYLRSHSLSAFSQHSGGWPAFAFCTKAGFHSSHPDGIFCPLYQEFHMRDRRRAVLGLGGSETRTHMACGGARKQLSPIGSCCI